MRLWLILVAGLCGMMIVAPLTVGGLSSGRWVAKCDKEMQHTIFLACLKHLPKGPEHLTASGNDWDEVVAECRVSAEIIACQRVWEE
jgi:hypothetical protein